MLYAILNPRGRVSDLVEAEQAPTVPDGWSVRAILPGQPRPLKEHRWTGTAWVEDSARLVLVDAATGTVQSTWMGDAEQAPVAPAGSVFVELVEGVDFPVEQKWDGAAWVPDPPPVVLPEDQPVTARELRETLTRIEDQTKTR